MYGSITAAASFEVSRPARPWPVAALLGKHQRLPAYRLGDGVVDQSRKTMQPLGVSERLGDRHIRLGAVPISVAAHPPGSSPRPSHV